MARSGSLVSRTWHEFSDDHCTQLAAAIIVPCGWPRRGDEPRAGPILLLTSPARPTDAKPMPVDDDRDQGLGHPVQITRADRILEAREGRLGGQGISLDRIAADQQSMYRIVSESSGVIAVGVAAGNTEDPLRKKSRDPVFDLPRHPAIVEALGQPINQAESVVHRLENHGPAVEAAVGKVKSLDQGAIKQLWKRDTLRRNLMGHRKASVCANSRLNTALLARGGLPASPTRESSGLMIFFVWYNREIYCNESFNGEE